MRPTVAYIDLAAIRYNVSLIRAAIPPATKIIAVVKANAYGHGAVQVSKAALEAGADTLAVAIVEEAEQLRQSGIAADIIVLGLSLPDAADQFIANDLIATVSTIDGVKALAMAAGRRNKKAAIMIKVDTGMNRIGVTPSYLPEFVKAVAAFPQVELCGIFTHLAGADADDKASANNQLSSFLLSLDKLDKPSLPLISAANSATIIDLPAGHFSAVRPGIILYGLPPSEEMHHQLNLRPAMELKTKIVYIKQVPQGSTVSYGGTYTTDKTVYLATLPIGYADGYSRQLSNKAQVLINGVRRNLVGRVCMDQIVVELGETCDAKVGDEAVLFGRQGSAEITVTELAKLAGTINYELVCAISARVPRIYVNQ